MKIIFPIPNGQFSLRLLQRICLPIFFICFWFIGNAQERTVTGKITDGTNNSPLAGVNVRVKGSDKGTTSNSAGEYRIAIKENAILQFSFIGFAPKEESIGSKSTIDVVL